MLSVSLTPKVSLFQGQKCSPYNRTGEWDSVFLGFSRDVSSSACQAGPCPRLLGPARQSFADAGPAHLGQGFHWSRPVVDIKTGVETPPEKGGKHRVFLPMNDDPAPPWRWNKAVRTQQRSVRLLACLTQTVAAGRTCKAWAAGSWCAFARV